MEYLDLVLKGQVYLFCNICNDDSGMVKEHGLFQMFFAFLHKT